eukprot:6175159-Pleurochrysis_carterae.AAC.1
MIRSCKGRFMQAAAGSSLPTETVHCVKRTQRINQLLAPCLAAACMLPLLWTAGSDGQRTVARA